MLNENEFHANAMTVQEVIEALQKLNPDTPIEQDGVEGVCVTLMNRGWASEHVTFDEFGTWDD